MGKSQERLDAKAAIKRAEDEVAQENQDKAVALLKAKLREQASAQTVLDNIGREIEDLKARIEQGNI